jgi:hypothetical protein
MSNDAFKKPVHTAACLIIGDEVLNGKVLSLSLPAALAGGG